MGENNKLNVSGVYINGKFLEKGIVEFKTKDTDSNSNKLNSIEGSINFNLTDNQKEAFRSLGISMQKVIAAMQAPLQKLSEEFRECVANTKPFKLNKENNNWSKKRFYD